MADVLTTLAGGRGVTWVLQVAHHRAHHGLPPVTRPLPPLPAPPAAPLLRCDTCGLVWTPDRVAYLMSHTRLAHGREATRQERCPR